MGDGGGNEFGGLGGDDNDRCTAGDTAGANDTLGP